MTDIAKPLAVVLLLTVLTLVSAQSSATSCAVTIQGQADLTVPMNQTRSVKSSNGKHYTQYACINPSGEAEAGVLVECSADQCAGGANNILSCVPCVQVYIAKFQAGTCTNERPDCDSEDVSVCKDNPGDSLQNCCIYCKDSLSSGGSQ